MAGIIADASAKAEAELRAEQEAAEQALADAQEREAKAATGAERKASAKLTKTAAREADKRQKSTASAKKAATSARKPIIYDARCTQLFKPDSHAETFRRIVTGETFRSFLPLDQQFQFAKSILAAIREDNPNKKDITAADIRAYCWGHLESGVVTGPVRSDDWPRPRACRYAVTKRSVRGTRMRINKPIRPTPPAAAPRLSFPGSSSAPVPSRPCAARASSWPSGSALAHLIHRLCAIDRC